MKRIAFCFFIGALFPLSSAALSATPGSFAGTFIGGDRSYSQELTIKKRAGGGFTVEAVVGTRGCSGVIDAEGNVDGDILEAKAESDDHQICTLVIQRTKKGVRVEGENCNSFHGASCEFDGDYRRKH